MNELVALKQQREQERKQQIEDQHRLELEAASEDALNEVGLTLERKDRAKIKSVVFMIREDVHAVMRQKRRSTGR